MKKGLRNFMKRTNLILIFLLCILITNKCYSQSEFAEFTKKFLNLLEKDYKKNPEKYNNLLSNTIDLIQNSNQSNNSPTLKTPEESVSITVRDDAYTRVSIRHICSAVAYLCAFRIILYCTYR